MLSLNDLSKCFTKKDLQYISFHWPLSTSFYTRWKCQKTSRLLFLGRGKKYLNKFSRLYWACRKVNTKDNLKNYLLRYFLFFPCFFGSDLFCTLAFFSRTVITLKLVLGRYLPFFGIDCVTINSDVSWGMSSSHSGHSYLLLFSKKKECHIKQNCLKRFLL